MGGGGMISHMVQSNNHNRNLQSARNSYREKLVELNNQTFSKTGEINLEKYPEVSVAQKQKIKEEVRKEIRKQVYMSYVKLICVVVFVIIVIYMIRK